MTIKIPSKKSVVRAGDILRTADPDSDEYIDAIQVLSDWRSLYAYPLNAFNGLLLQKCNSLGLKGKSIVARRLKRTPSIIAKLKRFPTMQLKRMQDIGGLRVIVPAVEDVRRLHESILTSHMAHEAVIPCSDYIQNPKADGYRSLHQVFKYVSTNYEELNPLGLKVEVQIRTKVQHSWATAVETLGVIEKAAFKSGEGTDDFKRFFLLSSALLSILEKQPVVESLRDVPPIELVKELEDLDNRLNITFKLKGVVVTVEKIFDDKKAKSSYCLLELDVSSNELRVWKFRNGQEQIAESFYKFRELENRDNENVEVVLISVDSLKKVQSAYPNYFLDCADFIKNLRRICVQIKMQNAN